MHPVENLCRICTRADEQEQSSFVSIFATTLEIRELEGHEPDDALVRTVGEVMAGCLDVDIKPNDQLPQKICRACMNKLRESWTLKETCKASEKRLRQLLRSELEPAEVKCEVDIEEAEMEGDYPMQMSFVDEEVLDDDGEEIVEEVPVKKVVNPTDPLHSESSWLFSDLKKGYYRTRKGDDSSWDMLELYDHRCCGCFRFFNSKTTMERHCKRDHKEEPHGDESKRYECGVCMKLFSSTDSLSFHQKMARSRQLFHCKLCDVLSPSKRQLKAHLKLHAANKIANNHTRELSERNSVSEGTSKKALEDVIPVDKCRLTKTFITFDYVKFDGFCCCDCGIYCDSIREMKRHGEKEHQGNRGFDEEHSCFACLRSFDSKNDYEKHMLELNAKHVYFCKTCQEVFRSSNKLQEHQQTSANHEGFVELEMLDVKEEVEVEEKVHLLDIKPSTTVAHTSRRRRTAVKERNESPVDDFVAGVDEDDDDDDDEDYEPEEASQDFKEPYGRRLYVQQQVKRNDPDLAEVSVVDISNQDVVRCCGCYQTFITEEELTDHSNQSHRQFEQPDDKDRPYECDRCFRRFVKAVSLQIHRQFVKTVQLFSCKLCDQKFNFQIPFLLHYEAHERNSGREDKRGPKPKKMGDESKFYCCFTTCKASYTDYSELLAHVDDNHGVKRNQFKDYRDTDDNCCEVCFRSFSNYRGLLRHVAVQRKANTGARHTCSTCGVQTKSLAALKDHENKHLGIKPYECDVCRKTFGTKTILKNHMIVHQADRPFSCEICGKTFARKRNYKDHSRIHTDEKPWECEICKLTFRIETQFLTHKRRHTGVRPYKCKFCDKVFSHATDRKRHEMAAHTGEKPHQCSFCPLAFIRKRQLVIHERTHTGEKPYECQHCGQAFIQQSYLTRHLATHKQRDEPAF
ncbi:zinc finger protein 420-like [Ochlerotatus camptorhynchus]|uniref:zinc finger protein 420-like n=1 Tax=Ochlerotatus camptorhynchus TaxID=644619 RepID=UPI0031DE4D0D